MKKQTEAKVIKHGETVKAVFGLAADVDPVKLCRKLRRLESAGAALGLRLCNGPEYAQGEAEAVQDDILRRLDALLGFRARGVPVFVNRDPRGYALKIDTEWTAGFNSKAAERLHADWGGYGVLAPDLN
jgi:hypothetical protein